jgi:hypothetical protein
MADRDHSSDTLCVPTVLVVEDDRDTREMERLALECTGFDVEVAANGRAALDALGQGSSVCDFAGPDDAGDGRIGVSAESTSGSRVGHHPSDLRVGSGPGNDCGGAGMRKGESITSD